MTHFYAGIGSRETPRAMQNFMTGIANNLAEVGYILRSGGARGADTAFERGTPNRDVYQPHHFLQVRQAKAELLHYNAARYSNARRIAQQFHPAWHKLGDFAQGLMTRNTFQILGHDLQTPSKFVICWTPDGVQDDQTTRNTGGTGQAIRLAFAQGVPVYNLARADTLEWVLERVNSPFKIHELGEPHGKSNSTD